MPKGTLGEVEDELFRFARVVRGQRRAAHGAHRPVAARRAPGGGGRGAARAARRCDASAALASFIVGAGRAHDLPAIVDRFVELAAAEREHEVAEVRSAVPLDDEQSERLAEALIQATGKEVEVKVVVDPTVLGGIVARVGDIVIDGTVRHRLEQLKETQI